MFVKYYIMCSTTCKYRNTGKPPHGNRNQPMVPWSTGLLLAGSLVAGLAGWVTGWLLAGLEAGLAGWLNWLARWVSWLARLAGWVGQLAG